MALTDKLKSIANAIREKTGESEKLALDEMPQAIIGIVTEAILQDKTLIKNGSYTADEGYDGLGTVIVDIPAEEPVLQDKTFTENGTYTADEGFDGFGNVTVEVAGSGEDTLTARFLNILTEYSNDELTELPASAFVDCSNLETANLPNVTSLPTSAFSGCSNLTKVEFPEAESIGSYAFNKCTNLSTAIFPKVEKIEQNVFYQCTNLKALVIRSATMCKLSGVNSFTQSAIANGTGYIYVPNELIDTYKAYSTWSNYASQFRSLEDYTVDGTITGELDETKI